MSQDFQAIQHGLLPRLIGRRQIGIPFENGITLPRRILTDAGEFLIKHPSWSPGSPENLILNEVVSAFIGRAARLAIPDQAWVRFDDQFCIGSRFIGDSLPNPTGPILDLCDNRDQLYDLAAFDVLLNNVDRDERNLLVSPVNSRPIFWAIDHSHCPVGGRIPQSDLLPIPSAMADDDIWQPWLRERLTDRRKIRQAAERLQRLDIGGVRAAISWIPGSPHQAIDGERIYQMLLDRQRQLLQTVETLSSTLPLARDEE